VTALVVRTAELVGALALATDLGTGQPLEHALRTALLAERLGALAGVGEDERADAFYVALLHSSGCTSDAHELARIYGDDIAPRAAFSVIDPTRPREVAAFVREQAGGGMPPVARAGRVARELATGKQRARRALAMHCEVAERFAERLGLGGGVRDALGSIFERWDGKGLPAGRAGAEIPLAARILHVARDVSIFHGLGGADAAREVVTQRVGKAYDPELARLVAPDVLGVLEAPAIWEAMLEAEPGARPTLTGEGLDEACTALADFADLKSPWWIGHSRLVAELAEAAAWRLQLGGDDVAEVRRAALVHDLGRVGVSNAVWDKPGALGLAEWEQVRLHPYYTERAFAASSLLAPLGALAAMHHERLDGSGYHRRLPASLLSRPARILGAADAYVAMTSDRPYRPSLTAEQAAAELRADVRGGRCDEEAVEAVLGAEGHRPAPRRERPDALTDRELEVLRLVAVGLTNRQIGARLHVSARTVGHHVQHIYGKISVSSRAAATLYAVERDLLRE
jgi:HD-GYP domain-containing protein (c-di-GMP phosphodiesterase class II)